MKELKNWKITQKGNFERIWKHIHVSKQTDINGPLTGTGIKK